MTLPLPWDVEALDGLPGAETVFTNAFRLLMPAAAGVMADVLAIDTFTRPNAATLDSAESGQVWEVLVGSWSVSALKAASAVGATAAVDVGTSDQDVTATIIPTTGAPGLVFRCSTTNNDRMSIQIDVTNSLFNLQKTVSGVTTSLVSATQTITAGVEYIVRVVAVGTSVTCYLDGAGVTLAPLSYTLTTPEQTQFGAYTRAGLRNTGAATFDDFVVRVGYPTGGGGGTVTLATLPAGLVTFAPESGGSYTRPSSRTDLMNIFIGTSNPGAFALENDLWAQTT